MATAENAKLQYEAGQTVVGMTQLTDSGDATTFDSAATLFSNRTGYTPDVKPNGVLTGGEVIASGTNDTVTVGALTLNLNGVVTSVNSGSDTITRPLTDVARINSVTIDNAGAIAIIPGTSGASAVFSETRGAAGGPPFIPVDSVEIAQVRVTTSAAGVIAAGEIYQTPGVHLERADYPLYDVNFDDASVTFISPLPASHTGSATKAVYASYSTPIFADVGLASDFVPPETSHSVTSTQVYSKTIGTTSSSLGQGSFTAYLADGVTDGLVQLKNEELWFKFYPDQYKSPYLLTQGKLGISRTFPAGDTVQATCTISAGAEAKEVNG